MVDGVVIIHFKYLSLSAAVLCCSYGYLAGVLYHCVFIGCVMTSDKPPTVLSSCFSSKEMYFKLSKKSEVIFCGMVIYVSFTNILLVFSGVTKILL